MKNNLKNLGLAMILMMIPCLLAGQNSDNYFKVSINPAVDMPAWAKLMYSDDPNVAEVDRLYRIYYEANPWEKNVHVRNYLYWRRQIDPRINSEGFINTASLDAIRAKNAQYAKLLRAHRGLQPKSMSWTCLGPYKTIQGEGSDRSELTWQTNVYCLDQSLSDPMTLYCGVEAGGVFKSLDKGMSWSWASFEGQFRTITAIRIHPSQTNIVYIGSGNQIWKTDDGGINWTSLYFENELSIHTIRIHVDFPDIILAASNKGLLRSVDGGNNWNKIMNQTIWDIEMQPGNANTVYLVANNAGGKKAEFYKSTDAGANFTLKPNGWYNSSDPNRNDAGARMTVTPADTDRVYVILIGEAKAGDNGYIGLYRSDDGGENWNLPNPPAGGPYNISAHPNLASIDPDGSGFHQGYYNLGIAASHTNANHVIIGFLSLWKTEDGGASFIPLGGYHGNTPYIHPDQQELLILGNDQWVANDGGINYSNDFFAGTVNHESRTRGVIGSDYWGFGSGWNEDILVGGRYHNGNSGYRPSYGDTHLRLGGAEAPTGYVNPGSNQAYFSDINTKLIPLDPLDDVISSPKLSMYPHETFYAAHSSNLEFDPRCYNHFYIGRFQELWKSTNGGNSYTLLKHFPTASEGEIMPIEISRSNPDVIYVYQRVTWCGGTLWKSSDGGINWIQKTFPVSAGCQRSGTMSLDPENENKLWIAFNNDDQASSGKVYRSMDGGDSWIDFTTNTLDGHRPHDIVYQAGTNGLVYLGTDKTVFYRDDSMSDWAYLGNGLPVWTNVNKFQPFYRDSKLRMATYGAGIWEIPFQVTGDPIVQPSVDKRTSACSRDTFYFDDFSILDHAGASWQWSFSPSPAYVNNLNVRNPKVVFGSEGIFSASLMITKNGMNYSKTIPDMVSIQSSQCETEIIPGRALATQVSGDYANIPSLPINGNEMTITAWVKPFNAQPDYTGIVISSSGPAAGINFRPNMELAYHWPGGAWWWSSGLIVPQDEWSYVALVVTPSSVTVHLNEDQATHNTATQAVDFRIVGALMGSYQGWGSRNYSGLIDEVAIYDRALSTEEIRALRHLTKMPGDDLSLVAYYQFNELEGLAYDKANVHHAALSGSASRTTSTVPAGGGQSQQMDVLNGGIYTFGELGMEIEFPAEGSYPDGRVVVSKLVVNPDVPAGPIRVLDPGYWIINNYGQPDFTEIDRIAFQDIPITGSQEGNPFTLRLHKRDSNAEGNSWNFVSPASAATAGSSGSASFTETGITNFSQFDMVVESALASSVLTFSAELYQQKQVHLTWEVSQDFESEVYEIERAGSHFDFQKIGQSSHLENKRKYKFDDFHPLAGRNYYRLKLIDRAGQFEYSDVRVIDLKLSASPVLIYPNPIHQNEKITIDMTDKDNADLRIYNQEGRLIHSRKLLNAKTRIAGVFPTTGWYICEVETANTIFYRKILVH